MKIRALPQKKQITYFEVQYFFNEGKQGKAKNVLAVRYSTHPNRFRAKNDESVQHREYFDLTCGREINRKTKKHFGIETSEEIKQRIKALKTDHKITTMFGIRQVRYKLPHKTLAGKWFHKRQLDINNLVFVHVTEDNEFTANFSWEGEEISVVVTPHRGALSSGQSVGVGYYTSASADAELAERMLELKNAQAVNSVGSDIYLTAEESAPITNDATLMCTSIDEETVPAEFEEDTPEQACHDKTGCMSPNDVIKTPRSRNSSFYRREKYVKRTEYEAFQEMCKNNIYGESARPMISLGLSFQMPSDDNLASSSA